MKFTQQQIDEGVKDLVAALLGMAASGADGVVKRMNRNARYIADEKPNTFD